MKYIPYEDAKRKREAIQVKFELGKTNKQIAEDMGISTASVSYYLNILGLSRPRGPSKGGVPICVVCRKNPVSESIPDICSNPSCISVFMHTVECTNNIWMVIGDKYTKVDSEMRIALDIQRRATFTIPDKAVVCAANSVTRVFRSMQDHIKYHAYMLIDGKRPPRPLWVDEGERRRYLIRQRDARQAHKNENSETMQPLRVRENAHFSSDWD